MFYFWVWISFPKLHLLNQTVIMVSQKAKGRSTGNLLDEGDESLYPTRAAQRPTSSEWECTLLRNVISVSRTLKIWSKHTPTHLHTPCCEAAIISCKLSAALIRRQIFSIITSLVSCVCLRASRANQTRGCITERKTFLSGSHFRSILFTGCGRLHNIRMRLTFSLSHTQTGWHTQTVTPATVDWIPQFIYLFIFWELTRS